MKLTITLIMVDDLDKDNRYYMYEIEGDNIHYIVTRSDEDLNNEDQDTKDYSNKYYMHKREDFTDREWEIAKYLFMFLWDSDNGTNTCVEKDIYEDDGFTKKEIENFMDNFQFDQEGVLDMYSDGGFEIYADFLSCFDLTSCNPWEDIESTNS